MSYPSLILHSYFSRTGVFKTPERLQRQSLFSPSSPTSFVPNFFPCFEDSDCSSGGPFIVEGPSGIISPNDRYLTGHLIYHSHPLDKFPRTLNYLSLLLSCRIREKLLLVSQQNSPFQLETQDFHVLFTT